MGRHATFDMNGGVKLPNTTGASNQVLIASGEGALEYADLKLPEGTPKVADLGKSLVLGADGQLEYSTATAPKILLPETLPASGSLMQSNGTAIVGSAYKVPTTVPTAGKVLQSNGTDLVASGFTLPATAPINAVGKALVVTAENVLEFGVLPDSTPTLTYWNGGSDFAPVLPQPSSMLAGKAGVTTFLVGGDTTDGRYCSSSGACCLWTVPTGVTEAEFQIWGGGGNSAGCSHGTCCAVGSAGGSGEYTYVRMAVTAGQTYTLCAGGAPTVGSCYSYCNLDGCNSFVCGANATCIMSCGGTNGSCGQYTFYDTYYPSVRTLGACDSNSSTMWVSSCSTLFGDMSQSYRFDAMCGVGQVASSNAIKTIAKVPSSIGELKTCGAGYNYGRYRVGGVKLDGSLTVAGTCDYTSQCYGWGCNFESCRAAYGINGGARFPGMGGVPAAYFCGSYDTCYGDRGASGLIRVSYK